MIELIKKRIRIKKLIKEYKEQQKQIYKKYFKKKQVKAFFKWYERLYLWLKGIRF